MTMITAIKEHEELTKNISGFHMISITEEPEVLADVDDSVGNRDAAVPLRCARIRVLVAGQEIGISWGPRQAVNNQKRCHLGLSHIT
ncbi:hypothetical protein NDU88_004719 [Pleurodeles waltl]|uniref:Uncharacterized protein n=1 Tax=Pleurodeles waltl TaxID=8319 RepID=A0AAV7L5G9_PLEWA|nr:hypothetical protein NDU88_004719 [Pleurodeles waltl]